MKVNNKARVKIPPQYKLQKKISRPSNWVYKVFYPAVHPQISLSLIRGSCVICQLKAQFIFNGLSVDLVKDYICVIHILYLT